MKHIRNYIFAMLFCAMFLALVLLLAETVVLKLAGAY